MKTKVAGKFYRLKTSVFIGLAVDYPIAIKGDMFKVLSEPIEDTMYSRLDENPNFTIEVLFLKSKIKEVIPYAPDFFELIEETELLTLLYGN